MGVPTVYRQSLARRIVSSVNPVALPVYAWLALIVLLPNALLIGASILKTANGFMVFEPSLVNYVRLWKSAGFWTLLGRTLWLSFLACALGALIAYPLAFYVGRVVRRHKGLLVVLIILPLWISLLMRVFAWRMILGQSGILNTFLVSSGLLDAPSAAFLYTPTSVLLVFAYIAIPFVFIAVVGAFEKIPQALLEASEDSGATALQTFRHVIWPLTRRSLAIGFALAFLVTVGDYVTPSMIGGIDGTTIGMVIASQFGMSNNWPYGSALAVVLILSVAVILGIVFALCPSRGILLGDEGVKTARAPEGRTERLGRLLGGCGFTATVLFLYAPLAIIILFSFGSSTLQAFPIPSLTLRWYGELAGNAALIAAAQRSLLVALLVVLVSSVIGTAFALILHYGRVAGSRACEIALALPLATPGIVLGVVMVLGTELFSIPSGIAKTVIGQSSFVMPVTLMLVLARLRRLDPSLMEASQDLGATRLQSFLHVLLPMIRGAIIGGALLGLTLSADEVMVTLFLTGSSPTLPIWVFNQMRFGFTPSVNAVFTLLAAVCLLAVLLSSWIAGRRKAAV
ncbi:ABC transporter permease subunit [Mangrovicella endophytica]|uniref:ABC transporter permease subunit n=1 Tax=Mangrovicella endophytica TaxID=2066697 RepID=UPI000C9E0F48|nr:ABC transporter permease subunit [Mangrovicella endophytica]